MRRWISRGDRARDRPAAPGRVDHAHGAVGHAFGGVQARCALGDLALDQAELRDRLAEGFALFGVADHVRQRVTRAADAGHAQLEAAHVEHVECDVVALAGSPSRFAAGILQSCSTSGQVDEPRMPSLCSSAPTVRPGVSRSIRNAENFSPSILAKTVYKPGDAAVGDPHLFAVQRVGAAVGRERGAGADVHGVGAGGGLRQPVGADPLRGGELGQVALASAPRCRTRPAAAWRCRCARRRPSRSWPASRGGR